VQLLQRHLYAIIYSAVFVLLLIGVIAYSGWTYIFSLTLYFYVPFLLFYFTLDRFSFSLPDFKISTRYTVPFLASTALAIALSHFLILNEIPALSAIMMSLQSEINEVRSSIDVKTSGVFQYLISWNIKAIVPFLLFYFAFKKQWKLFAFFAIFGSFLAVAMMQKSFIIWIWSPTIILLLSRKKWLWILSLGVFVLCVLFFQVWISNARLRGGINDVSSVTNSQSGTSSEISGSLVRRVLLVPGQMVSEWYRIIPDEKPFLYGRDFSLYCKITGKKQADYATELYPLVYPNYAERGLTGSVNVAHFMRTYSNFGPWGFPLAALLLSLLIFFMNNLLDEKTRSIGYCFNIFPLLLLNSGAIMTMFLSAGWGLIFVLLWIHKKDFVND